MVDDQNVVKIEFNSLDDYERGLIQRSGSQKLFAFNNKPANAFIYTRYSSKKKNNDAKDKQATTEDQIYCAQEYAKKYLEYTVPLEQIFDDYCVSGAISGRNGLQQLIDIIDQTPPNHDSPISHILVRDNARIFRSAQIEELIYKCVERNIKIIDVLNKIDLTDDTRLIEKKVLFFTSELTRLNHIEWAKNSYKTRAKQGFVTSGKIYGFMHQRAGAHKIYVFHPEESKIVKQIFNLYGFGGKSAGEICDILTEAGFETPKGQKNRWNVNTVTGILDNLKYRGIFVYGRDKQGIKNGKKIVIKGDLEDVYIYQNPTLKLIPDDLWEAVKNRRAKSKKREFTKYGGRTKFPNVLTNTFFCAECKKRLHQKGRAKNPKYRCPNKECPTNDPSHEIRLWLTKEIGVYIIKRGLKFLSSDYSIKNIQSYFKSFKREVTKNLRDTGKIRQEIRDLNREIAGYDKLIGEHHEHIYPATLAEVEEKRKQKNILERELDEAIRIREKIKNILDIKPSKIIDLLENFDTLVDSNVDSLHETLEKLIGKIYVKPVFTDNGELLGIEGYAENDHISMLKFFNDFFIPCQQIPSGTGRTITLGGTITELRKQLRAGA